MISRYVYGIRVHSVVSLETVVTYLLTVKKTEI